MYMTRVKTVAVEAMKNTFDADYPVDQFKNLLVSIEFPEKEQNYPSIWVSFSPAGSLQTAGIAHFEIGDPADADGPDKRFTRWRFGGSLSFTGVALTSLEADLLFDEIVRVLAFGSERSETATFRSYLEDNEFIGMNANFDEIGQEGFGETPGTPWGTDEVIYERTATLTVIGEFVSNGVGDLVTLEGIEPFPYSDREEDPTSPGGWL